MMVVFEFGLNAASMRRVGILIAGTFVRAFALPHGALRVNQFVESIEKYIREYAGDKLEEWEIKEISEYHERRGCDVSCGKK